MQNERAVSLLRRAALFAELSDDALQWLAERAIERSYRKGQLLFYQGDPGDSLFVMVEGMVKVSVLSEQGDEMVLVTLQPPDVFGEVAIVDAGPRSASAEAIEASKVLVVSRAPLLELMRSHPDVNEAVLRSLGNSLRRLTEQAADLVFLDLHGRVAKLVVGLVDKQTSSSDDTVVLDLHITQSDIGRMVGGSRQSVNQILKSFEKRGFVEVQGSRLTVKDLDGLRRRAHL